MPVLQDTVPLLRIAYYISRHALQLVHPLIAIKSMIEVQQCADQLQLVQQLKKLQMLSIENDRLRQQHDQFIDQIQSDANRIAILTNQLLAINAHHQEFKKINEEVTHKWNQAEIDLQQKTKEYCHLYNYLYADNKRPASQFDALQIQIYNEISAVQQDTDAQIIEQLQSNLKLKNREMVQLHRQIGQANMQLLQSSYQYQEQIRQLKQKVKATQANESRNSTGQSKRTHREDGQFMQFFAALKLEELKTQLQLYKNEASGLRKQDQQFSKQLISLKKQYAILYRQNADKQHDIERLRSALETKLELQAKKTSALVQEFNNCFPRFDYHTHDLLQFFSRPAENLKDQQQHLLIQQNMVLKGRIVQLEIQNQNLDIASTTVFEKLKEIIIKYIPILQKQFRYLDFKKAEIQFIDEKSQGLNKTLSALNEKHGALLRETNALRDKKLQLQSELRELRAAMDENRGVLARMTEERNILLIAIESFQRHNRNTLVAAQQMCENEQQVAEMNDDYPLSASASSHGQNNKVRLLQRTVALLEDEKIELLAKIKYYHLKIHQLDTQLSTTQLLRQHKTYTIQNPQISTINVIERLMNLNTHVSRSASSQSYASIVKELAIMRQIWKEQKQLMLRQFEKRWIQCSGRYNSKCGQLMALQQSENALRAEVKRMRQQKVSRDERQLTDNQMLRPQMQQQRRQVVMSGNDNSMISQSTIANIIDLLRKYEKQFNKFVQIYEQSVQQINQSVNIQHNRPSNNQNQTPLNYKPNLSQNQKSYAELNRNKTANLEQLTKLVEQKEQLFEIEMNLYKERLERAESANGELVGRLQHTLDTVQGVALRQLKGGSPASLQSVNTMLSMIGLKNSEINGLRQAILRANGQLSVRAEELRLVSESQQDEIRLYSNQQRILKQLIEEADIVGVMQSVLEFICRQRS